MQSAGKPAIAFLGIGLMGKPMATRLLQAGYAVTAWNRTRSKAEELVSLGARVRDSAADAVRDADIVITMLEAGPIVLQVIDDKLCNQLVVGGTLNIVAEALLLAQAGGADPTAVRAAIRGGFAESRILEVHGQRMLERNFMPGGQVKSQYKDLENVLIAAGNAGLRLPVTELVTENYEAVMAYAPQADQSAVLLALEHDNPGKRLGDTADQLPG